MSQGATQTKEGILKGEDLLAKIESTLGLELALFVRQRQLGWVLVGEVGIFTRRDPDRVRGADLAFISRQRAPDGPPKGFLEVGPEIVAEIISPGDRWQEVQRKLEEYFALGVEQVWVVDPKNRVFLVYRSAVKMIRFTEEDTLIGEGVLEGFKLPVGALFGS